MCGAWGVGGVVGELGVVFPLLVSGGMREGWALKSVNI